MQYRFAAALLLVAAIDACAALPQRTFVSTFGNDANTASNCSLVSPCRSFGAALGVTAVNGEIVVLDSGGYGAVAIDKSVAIVAPPGVYAGISVGSGNDGVTITTDGVNVTLRGLTINSQGGLTGVYVNALNVAPRIERCVIENFNAPSQFGVSYFSSGGSLAMVDSVVRGNTFEIGAFGPGRFNATGVLVDRNAAYGVALADINATITHSIMSGNGSYGLRLDSGGVGDTIVAVSDSTMTRSGFEGIAAYANGATGVRLAVARATLSGNGQSGITAYSNGTGPLQVEVMNSTIKSNSFGLLISRLSGSGVGTLTAVDNLIASNSSRGISAMGSAITAIASRNTITMNLSYGMEQTSSAVFETSSDNVVRGNNGGGAQTNGVFTPIGGL